MKQVQSPSTVFYNGKACKLIKTVGETATILSEGKEVEVPLRLLNENTDSTGGQNVFS